MEKMAVSPPQREDIHWPALIAAIASITAVGIAMGNAAPDIKSVADWTTASNADDGFAMAIDRLLDESPAS